SIESDASSNDILIAISKLLQKKQPFVFICSGLPTESNKENDDVNERRKITTWMKDNKAAIGQLIKGHIHIIPETTKRTELESFSVTFERFWGYPMFIVATENEAREKANALLC
ncbi:TPA: hypothetical protein ROF83_002714, partial [Citrobacter freundii]|nr:hypothetical protein [Citrobacter freundii]